MIFQWHVMLWTAAIIPLLIALYLIVVQRKRREAARYNLALGANTRTARIKRHAPAVLFLVAVIALIGAMGRPAAVITLPNHRDVVILAVDVSGSMGASDMAPTRLVAAQKAARAFIEGQPRKTQIGIVAFAGTALVVQRPTQNREDLLEAIDRLQTQDGTTIGGAIIASLQTLFPNEEFELPDTDGRKPGDKSAKKDEVQGPPVKPAVPAGSETSAAIVLLTDGQATASPDPVEAARLAADRGVRIFTVGVGTTKGEVVKHEGASMRVQLDEETLKKIADLTRARYFSAGSTNELKSIYSDLNARLVSETREAEITALFVAVAVAALVTAAGLSLLWFHRIV